jgi:ATP-binding cassette subfamily F protein 3
VTPFDGDLDDYTRTVLSRDDDGEAGRRSEKPAGSDRAEKRRRSAELRAELAPLQRRIKAADADMDRLSKRLAEIDAALADTALHVRDPARVTALSKERADATTALAAAEELWLSLSGEYESAMVE